MDTHIKRGFPSFPLSHSVVSWYSYHQRQLSDLNRCCHSWVDLPKYGTTRIIHDNVCSDNCHLGKDMIICGMRTMKWLHSPCHRDLIIFILVSTHYLLLMLRSLKPIFNNPFFLVMLFFFNQQSVSITLQCVQAIVILQHAIAFEKHSSFLSHITTSAPSSLANLWQMTTF